MHSLADMQWQFTQIADMHVHDVLHCDIHPGNAGLTPCSELGELEAPFTAESAESMHPTFIDFGWSLMGGFHPRASDGCSPVTWPYASDRVLCGDGKEIG